MINSNSVVLDLERYNELRDLEKNVNEGKRVVVDMDFNKRPYDTTVHFYTDSKIVEELSIEILNLKNSLKETIKEKESIRKSKEYTEKGFDFKLKETINRNLNYEKTLILIRKMSIWEFLKWRKN